MNKNFNPGPAAMGLNHGAGKGGVERSTKWREKYSEIQWGVFIVGMKRVGQKQVKKYDHR